MGVALQIRDVPEEIRDALAAKAASRGQSLQVFLLDVVRREAKVQRNVDLFFDTADLRIELPSGLDPVAIIREGRDQGFDVDRDA